MSPFISMAQARHHVFIRQKEVSALRTARLAQAKEADNADAKSGKSTEDEDQSKSAQSMKLPSSFHVALEYIFQMARDDISTLGPALSGKYLKSLVSVLSKIPIGGMAQEDAEIIRMVSLYLTGFANPKTATIEEVNDTDIFKDNTSNRNISNTGHAISGLVALVAASASLGLALDVIFTLLSSNAAHWYVPSLILQQVTHLLHVGVFCRLTYNNYGNK